jgi:L-arabinose isomerase
VVVPEQPMPKLPVAQAVWVPKPGFEEACACWIYGGGAHHTSFSQAVTAEMLEDFAAIADIEFLIIDGKTTISDFRKEIRWNEVFYAMNKGWVV